MTSDERAEERLDALLAKIAAQLEMAIADQALKRYTLMNDRVAPDSVRRVLKGKNHTIETLVDVCDLVGCELSITIKRVA